MGNISDKLTDMKNMFRRLIKNKQEPSAEFRKISTLGSISAVPMLPMINIQRKAFNVSQFNEEYIQIPTTTTEKLQKLKPDLSMRTWIRRLRSLFPITLWLPEYNIKEYLVPDIIVGITIAIFQVPQSMSYCLIAHVPPLYGLYSSFFPPLFYTILGTSMHISFGTYAIVSGVMTGVIVTEIMQELGKDPNLSATIVVQTVTQSPISGDKFADLQNIDIAILAAFIIGAYILVFGIFQLGFISNIMSEELLSGFTTSASIIVFWSQVGNLLGISLGHPSGPLNLPYSVIEVFQRIREANLTTLIISAICLSILLIFKLGVNRVLKAKLGIKTPFPIELFVIIGVTLVSNYLRLKDPPYNVKIVGKIGNSFPQPLVPRLDLFGMMWSKCIATAIVGYTLAFSVGRTIAKKHGYRIDPNQEMIAIGVTNIVSSIFQCIPTAASLSRTPLQDTAGGKTQVVSLVNCLCIVVVILALGRYLEQLPVCVLASCIAVALTSLMRKIGTLKRFWTVSKLDGMIWLITFVSVLVISVDLGIYISLICSLLLLIYKTSRTKTYLLGAVSDNIYVPINKFNKARAPDGFKIFQMCGPLNYSNAEYFNSELETKCDINVPSVLKYMKSKKYKKNVTEIQNQFNEEHQPLPKLKLIHMALSMKPYRLPKYVIIDCSMFSFIDFTGITNLKKTILGFEEIGIKGVLSGVHIHLEKMLNKEGFFDAVAKDRLYKTIHDAVVFIQEFECREETQENGNRVNGKMVVPTIYVSTEEWM